MPPTWWQVEKRRINPDLWIILINFSRISSHLLTAWCVCVSYLSSLSSISYCIHPLRKYETLTHRWFDVEPPSTTLADIKPTFARFTKHFVIVIITYSDVVTKTRDVAPTMFQSWDYIADVGSTLGQCCLVLTVAGVRKAMNINYLLHEREIHETISEWII